MKKCLFSLLALGAFTVSNAQATTLFEDSFETYTDFAIANVGDWTLTDVDKAKTYGFQGITFLNAGSAKSFQVFNSTTTVPPIQAGASSDWTARTGKKVMAAFASVDKVNNDWLISPKVVLGSSDNILKFFAKAGDSGFGLEEFNVYISTTDTNIASFTKIGEEYIDNEITFAEYTFDLSAYNGKEIYFAVQCVSDDQFGFIVDDFSVSGNKLGLSDTNLKEVTRVYPNPVKESFELELSPSINKAKLNVEVFDLAGRKVASFGPLSKQYNIAALPKGTYVLKINDGTTKIVKKLIKN